MYTLLILYNHVHVHMHHNLAIPRNEYNFTCLNSHLVHLLLVSDLKINVCLITSYKSPTCICFFGGRGFRNG